MQQKTNKLAMLSTILLVLFLFDLFIFHFLSILEQGLVNYFFYPYDEEITGPSGLLKLIISDIPALFALGIVILSAVSLRQSTKNGEDGKLLSILVGVISLIVVSVLFYSDVVTFLYVG